MNDQTIQADFQEYTRQELNRVGSSLFTLASQQYACIGMATHREVVMCMYAMTLAHNQLCKLLSGVEQTPEAIDSPIVEEQAQAAE